MTLQVPSTCSCESTLLVTRLLASVSTFHLPLSWGRARTRAETSAKRMSWKAASSSAPHFHGTFPVSWNKGFAQVERFGMWQRRWFSMPPNLCTSFMFLGRGQLRIATPLMGSCSRWLWEIFIPRKIISLFSNSHLLSLRHSPFSPNFCKTRFIQYQCITNPHKQVNSIQDFTRPLLRPIHIKHCDQVLQGGWL